MTRCEELGVCQSKRKPSCKPGKCRLEEKPIDVSLLKEKMVKIHKERSKT